MKTTVLFITLALTFVPAGTPATGAGAGPQGAGRAVFRLDAKRSTLVAHARRGGLLWFLGHDHLIAARDFTGAVEITPGALIPASLEISVRSDSLVETSSAFTDQQKKIIDGELRSIVLPPGTYPEIVFKSTGVTVERGAGEQFDVKIAGALRLHGVTRQIVIPAHVTIEGDELRARGTFDLERHDFEVKATSAKGGTIRVRDTLEFTFDIVAHRE